MSVVAVGDFDGVHLGHRMLLRSMVSFAASFGAPSVAVTFDRNCKSYLRGSPIAFLSDLEEKTRMILSEGVDSVSVLSLDDAFMGMSPSAFLTLLKDRYGCTDLFGGTDFRFGSGGAGRLIEGSVVCGIRQHVVDLKTDLIKISSSSIRDALADGLVERANFWLGQPYSISGPVISGKQLGRTIGFPTINLAAPAGKVLPKNGVYVTDTLIDGVLRRSVTNVGVRPSMDDGSERNVETHILNADGDFYGKTVTVLFRSRLRDELRFFDLGSLMRQMRDDCDAAFLWKDSNGIL